MCLKLHDHYLDSDEEEYVFVTAALDEVACLLNLRTIAMQYGLLLYSFIIVSPDELIVFTDNPYEAKDSLQRSYHIRRYNDFLTYLSGLENKDIRADKRTCMSVIDALNSSSVRILRSTIPL